jgi:uncharacterized protein (TIGR01244 family)
VSTTKAAENAHIGLKSARKWKRAIADNLVLFVGVLLLSVAHGASEPDSAFLGGLQNVLRPQANWVVSGALNQTDVENLRKAGVKYVIDLRTEEETPDFDEARAVAEQGLMYHPIPIKGVESLTKVNARKLDALFGQIGAEPALIHCSSGNRVGALIAVREAWIKGRPVDAAIAEGKRWGLTRLEGPVRVLLESQAQQDEGKD